MNSPVFHVINDTKYASSPGSDYPFSGQSAAVQVRRPGRRVEYVRVCQGVGLRAIAEFFPDGHEEFVDKEPSDVELFRFTPSDDERQFAAELLDHLSEGDAHGCSEKTTP